MKKYFALLLFVFLSGCATHADITVPALQQVPSDAWRDKSFTYKILYSQPRPGLGSGTETQPLGPFEQVELSVTSAATLKKLPDYIAAQIPSSRVSRDGAADYTLVVEIRARHKRGPAYSDYEAGKSVAKNLLSLGFAASEYIIVADFEATYRLQATSGETVASKHYDVKDAVKHQRGDFESLNSLNDYAGQMLEKHLVVTLNDFFAGIKP